ncbi:aldehyde-activating protein [Candidatus Uhrbacteria bacterium CG10_big_fil_rev_8_21_14_0_10_48_11]|uniref:Aldehyde-activating protein n=1 Tax=Candidatus Uhrbacteria bacterium CG10_big_fil_rev_8_21_14_0_10_48_11 TaxID=1975037 RepID=A0A2M8LDM8_9BACT|nr:MAG: aldehyde-activating protein [Candidatus Uhrbacteria bacterium CG10_big_fil_rev_8_21_14_0_10_48_11]
MQTYTGGCQCGAVRYSVTTDLAKLLTCNCSRCGKLGAILTFVPQNQFELLSGEDNLTSYLFNTKKINHLFCTTCGIESFARGSDKEGNKTIAINVRCLDGIDPETLSPTPVDGKNW